MKVTKPSDLESQVNFVLEKVSERHVAKYGASSFVYRSYLEDERNLGNVKIIDILSEF